MTKADKIFITWGPSGTRAGSLAENLGFKAYFFGKKQRHRTIFHSALTYFGKSIKNIRVVIKNKPGVIAVTNTQWIIACLNLVLGWLVKAKVVFDSHSAAFDHPFIKYPRFLSLFFAKKANLSLVTNQAHKDLLESKGARAMIITDIPFEDVLYRDERNTINEKFNICFVCSFGQDEPYEEVFEAVRNMDDVCLHVTGNYSNKNINPDQHKNVVFTGFLSTDDYIALINNVDCLMVLTTRENTMQRGGSEAISVGNPLITSSTQMLYDYFKLGTVFVDNHASSISGGITKMMQGYKDYKNQMQRFKKERKETFSSKIQEFASIIES